MIVRALYSLNSSGAAFRANLCECMKSIGYTPCLVDPDLWTKPEIDGDFEYYSYVLCYVDDIMVIRHRRFCSQVDALGFPVCD